MTEPSDKALTLTPIGVVHSPLRERREAPRQSAAAQHIRGTIELFSGHGFEHALSDIERWSHLWVVFWFHLNEGWRPKVLPPRSQRKRGLFSTRSPHRPNPIGLSAVKLESVSGLVLEVSGLDILDGSPVLDIKPYVAYTDALPTAEDGWLPGAEDPLPPYEIEFLERATAQLAFLLERYAIDLRAAIVQVLALGPEQHPYRRIKSDGATLVLAVKDWRARFQVLEGRRIAVIELFSGYRPRELALGEDPALEPHRTFSELFRSSVALVNTP